MIAQKIWATQIKIYSNNMILIGITTTRDCHLKDRPHFNRYLQILYNIRENIVISPIICYS